MILEDLNSVNLISQIREKYYLIPPDFIMNKKFSFFSALSWTTRFNTFLLMSQPRWGDTGGICSLNPSLHRTGKKVGMQVVEI